MRRETCLLASARLENRGLAWIIGAFAICPCHLPLTLTLIGTLLSGTAVGTLITHHAYVAGGVIPLGWLIATWRGLRYIRLARKTRN